CLVELVRWRRRGPRWRRLRNRRVETLRRQRRDRHEDHQQHQQNINERSDVDIRLGRDLFLHFFHWCLLPADLIIQALCEQANLINTGVADVVDNLNDVAVLRAKVALDENFLLELGRQQIIHSRCKLVDVDLVLSEIELSVACDGDENRVIPIGLFHVDRVLCPGKFDAYALLQHWSDNHENDQKDKHHVRHRRDVDVGGDFSSTSAGPSHSHSYFLPPCCLMK